jgi:uncharacterized NAD(P)/FAD-binding protein YdhS
MVVVVVLIAKIFFQDRARRGSKFEFPLVKAPHTTTRTMVETRATTSLKRAKPEEEEEDQPIRKVVAEPSELDVLRLEYQALREQNAWLFRRLEKLERENDVLLGHRRPFTNPQGRNIFP